MFIGQPLVAIRVTRAHDLMYRATSYVIHDLLSLFVQDVFVFSGHREICRNITSGYVV